MATVGLELVLSILFGLLGGRWLDGRLGTEPWLMLLGFIVGLATAVRFLLRAARRNARAMDADGFKTSSTGRAARFALNQKDNP